MKPNILFNFFWPWRWLFSVCCLLWRRLCSRLSDISIPLYSPLMARRSLLQGLSLGLISTIAILALLLLNSCSISRPVAHAVVHDTCYVRQVQLDSVRVDVLCERERVRDTLYIRERTHELRYRLLHDTVRSVVHDTVVFSPPPQPPAQPPSWLVSLRWRVGVLCFAMLCIFAIFVYFRCR